MNTHPEPWFPRPRTRPRINAIFLHSLLFIQVHPNQQSCVWGWCCPSVLLLAAWQLASEVIRVPAAVSAASAGLQIILPMSAAAAAADPEHLPNPAAAVGPELCTPPAMAVLVAPGVAARATLVAPGVASRLPNLVAARLLGIVAPGIVTRPWASP